MRIVKLDQRTEQWKAWRREGLTATETPVLCTASPFKTPYRLWLEKTGRAEEPDLSAIPAVRYGIAHEDEARQLAELVLKTRIEPACGEYDADPRFRASFDGLTEEGIPVEIKAPGADTLFDVKTKGPHSKAVQYYEWQVQHQLLVSGAPYGWLVFYDENGPLQRFRIDADETRQSIIYETGKRFLENIRNDVPPEMDPVRDIYTPEGEQIAPWMEAADNFVRLQGKIDELEKELGELKSAQSGFKETLISLMGDAQKADFGGVTISISYSKSSIDYKALFESRKNPATDDELARYRTKSVRRVLARATDRILAKGANPEHEQNVALIEAAERSIPLFSLSF